MPQIGDDYWRMEVSLSRLEGDIARLISTMTEAQSKLKELMEILKNHLNHCDYCTTVRTLKDG